MAKCQHLRPTHPRRYFDVCEEDEQIFFKDGGAWKVINFTRWYRPQNEELTRWSAIKQIPRHKRVMKLENGETVLWFKNEKANTSTLGNTRYRVATHIRPGWYYLEIEEEKNG